MLSFAAKAQGLLKRFRKDEDGAMTVEWVAIAAAVVVGAVAMTWSVLKISLRRLMPLAPSSTARPARSPTDRSHRAELQPCSLGLMAER